MYNNQNPFDFQKDKMNTQNSFESFNKNKSGKKQESYNTEYSGLDYLGSKEEFFEGEIKNKVK